jgi:hypothetical protein
VGQTAITKAREVVNELFGSIASKREEFNFTHAEELKRLYDNSLSEEELERENARLDKLWEDYIQLERRQSLEAKIIEDHPENKSPNKDCDSCKGTGSVVSTYNRLSKWDWFQIGGRWTGALDGYKPEDDPNNQEQCFICGGTGMRSDELGNAARQADPSYTCNGCQGKGSRVTWPTNYMPNVGDTQPVSVISRLKFRPFAIVTPAGEWFEKGSMGWFGMVSGEQGKEEWAEKVQSIFEQYKDYYGTIVDCHI